MNNNNKNNNFYCNLCKLHFPSERSLTTHSARKHTAEERGTAYVCRYCAHGSNDKNALRSHELMHPEARAGGLGFRKRLRSRSRSRQPSGPINHNNNEVLEETEEDDIIHLPSRPITTTPPVANANANGTNVLDRRSRLREPKRSQMIGNSPSKDPSESQQQMKQSSSSGTNNQQASNTNKWGPLLKPACNMDLAAPKQRENLASNKPIAAGKVLPSVPMHQQPIGVGTGTSATDGALALHVGRQHSNSANIEMGGGDTMQQQPQQKQMAASRGNTSSRAQMNGTECSRLAGDNEIAGNNDVEINSLGVVNEAIAKANGPPAANEDENDGNGTLDVQIKRAKLRYFNSQAIFAELRVKKLQMQLGQLMQNAAQHPAGPPTAAIGRMGQKKA